MVRVMTNRSGESWSRPALLMVVTLGCSYRHPPPPWPPTSNAACRTIAWHCARVPARGAPVEICEPCAALCNARTRRLEATAACAPIDDRVHDVAFGYSDRVPTCFRYFRPDRSWDYLCFRSSPDCVEARNVVASSGGFRHVEGCCAPGRECLTY